MAKLIRKNGAHRLLKAREIPRNSEPDCLEVPLYRAIRRRVAVNPPKAVFFFSFDNECTRRVKAGRRSNLGRDNQLRAFTPAVILFIALPETENKIDPG
ncbi:MAG: hypothetical protein ABSG65_30450 [Bryobacteraceae bacterium]